MHDVTRLLWFWLIVGQPKYKWWYCSESSFKLASEGGTDIGKAIYPSPTLPNTFAFKIQDRKGRMHRFMCGMIWFYY